MCGYLLLLLCTVAPAAAFKLAVIGDYGTGTTAENNVATMVNSYVLSLGTGGAVATVGDNNYDTGAASDLVPHVGKYYHKYMYPYGGGTSCGGASPCGAQDGLNRFWPATGNHDWGNKCSNPSGLNPFKSWMPLPSLGKSKGYYEQVVGDIHLFMLDSDCNAVDGNTATSAQATWLKNALAASTKTWKLVFAHHAPYSSGNSHGSQAYMRWNFESWGATAVLSGHDHTYERILPTSSGFPYFVNGLGGQSKNGFISTPITGSKFRYASNWGAMIIDSTATTLTFAFRSIDSGYPVKDCYKITVSGSVKSYATC